MRYILLFFSILIINLNGNAQNNQFMQSGSNEFKELFESNNGILLDVRTSREFKNGHLKNAEQLNYYSFDFKKKLLTLSKDQPIYLYCNTGYRSEKAAEILINNGYSNVYNLEHGIMEWQLENLPVIVDDDANPDTDNMLSVSEYRELISNEELVFIDFYAPWCGPCRKMMPMIDSLKVEFHNKIKIEKINADASKELIKDLKIIGVPQLYLFRDGEIVYSKDKLVTRDELVKIFEIIITK